jgi:nicotinate-nucleotide adenylyltransferase
MARAALRELHLARILWLPTGKPAYRQAPLAAARDRVAMLQLAIEGEPQHAIDARELENTASGYTVDTLKSLHGDFPKDEMFLLMGSDQYAKFGSWREPGEVAQLARLAVFARPGFQMDSKFKATVVPMPPLAISASDIRARVARGEDISAQVPAAVAGYIARQGLYR